MTVNAPSHREWFVLSHLLHLIDVPVAGYAAHTTRDVSSVIEIDVVWQSMDLDPRNRIARPPTVMQRLELGTLGPNAAKVVTPDGATGLWQLMAYLSRRNRGMRRFVDRGMAVTTVHLQ